MITHVLETIPHNRQRYETVGDWYQPSVDYVVITSSAMGDWRYEILVKFHELIEQTLCKHRNVSEDLVTKFDIDYEATRTEYSFSEPGDDPNAPYYKEHQFATKLERELAKELGVNWSAYEKAVNNL